MIVSAARTPSSSSAASKIVGCGFTWPCEREFAVAPIVRSFELGHSRRDALYRLDRVTSDLGLDRERARGWTIGQTMAWGFESEYHPTHLQTVRWLLEVA